MWERIVQAFFPDRCIGCAAYGAILCTQCISVCAVYTGEVPDLPVARIAIRFEYAAHIRRVILLMKYARQRRVAQLLANAMPSMYAQRTCYVPIPAAPVRVAQRGYDQAVLLAQALAIRHTGWVSTQLVRVRDTPTQARLNRQQRQVNVQQAFQWRGGIICDPIVLVDDVCTTGATLHEAIRVLNAAGMSNLAVQVVARGVCTISV